MNSWSAPVMQAANLSTALSNPQLHATVFVPNNEAITRLTSSNNITVGDLYNNPLNVLTLVCALRGNPRWASVLLARAPSLT